MRSADNRVTRGQHVDDRANQRRSPRLNPAETIRTDFDPRLQQDLFVTDVMPILRRWSGGRGNGYVLAAAAITGALILRLVLEPMGRFEDVSLVLAGLAPVFLADRRATAVAICLSIFVNLVLIPREDVADEIVSVFLLAVVGVLTGELGRARHILKLKSMDLSIQLQCRDAMLSAVLASVPVIALGKDREIQYMSPTACRLFRVNDTEAVGRPFSAFVEYFDLDVPGETAGDCRGASRTGRRSDGETFPLDIQQCNVPDNVDGCRTLLCLTDLSGWHGSELRNQELAVQLNQVWRLNSLGEMGAILAHELNQPLTAATSYLQASQADLDRAGVLGDSANRTIDLAQGQILRAGNIIRRVRNLLIVDERALQPERVSSMIDDLNPIIALLVPEGGAHVRIDVDTRHDHVLADCIQIQQALTNLVRNAIEAVAGGDRREVLIVGRRLPDGRFGLGVEDSGPGIAPDQVDSIFRPLTTTKPNGMGLGLSVTRAAVERHGSTLTVRRSDLGGAAFEFSLAPVSDEDGAVADVAAALPPRSG